MEILLSDSKIAVIKKHLLRNLLSLMRKRSEKIKGFLKNIENKLWKSYFSGLMLLHFLTALHNVNSYTYHTLIPFEAATLQFLNDYELFKSEQSRSLLEILLELKNCINGLQLQFFKYHLFVFISLSWKLDNP